MFRNPFFSYEFRTLGLCCRSSRHRMVQTRVLGAGLQGRSFVSRPSRRRQRAQHASSFSQRRKPLPRHAGRRFALSARIRAEDATQNWQRYSFAPSCQYIAACSCVIKVIVNCVSFSRDYFKPRRRRRVGLQPLQRTDLRELSDARRPRVPGAGRVPCAVRFLSQYLRTRTYRGHGLGRRARRPQFRANKFREGLGSEIFSSRSNFVSLLAGGVARPVQVMVKRRSFRKDSQGQNSGDFLKRVTPF